MKNSPKTPAHASIDPVNMFRSERFELASLRLAQAEIHVVLSLEIPWEDKFNLVFSDLRSGVVFSAFENLCLNFKWVDPDQGCKEDLQDFVQALDARVEELSPLFKLIEP